MPRHVTGDSLNIPPELVVKVLEFLNPIDLCICRLVTKEWRALVEEVAKWQQTAELKEVGLSANSRDMMSFGQYARRYQLIQNISKSARKKMTYRLNTGENVQMSCNSRHGFFLLGGMTKFFLCFAGRKKIKQQCSCRVPKIFFAHLPISNRSYHRFSSCQMIVSTFPKTSHFLTVITEKRYYGFIFMLWRKAEPQKRENKMTPIYADWALPRLLIAHHSGVVYQNRCNQLCLFLLEGQNRLLAGLKGISANIILKKYNERFLAVYDESFKLTIYDLDKWKMIDHGMQFNQNSSIRFLELSGNTLLFQKENHLILYDLKMRCELFSRPVFGKVIKAEVNDGIVVYQTKKTSRREREAVCLIAKEFALLFLCSNKKKFYSGKEYLLFLSTCRRCIYRVHKKTKEQHIFCSPSNKPFEKMIATSSRLVAYSHNTFTVWDLDKAVVVVNWHMTDAHIDGLEVSKDHFAILVFRQSNKTFYLWWDLIKGQILREKRIEGTSSSCRDLRLQINSGRLFISQKTNTSFGKSKKKVKLTIEDYNMTK